MTNIPVQPDELVGLDAINTWARGYVRKTSSKTVNTSTTLTDLLNGEFTLPAGALSIDKILRLSVWGDAKNNSGASRDIPRFQLTLGGTTLLYSDVIGATVWLASTIRLPWRFVCEIQNLGAANSQVATMTGRFLYSYDGAGSAATAFATGEGLTYADPLSTITFDGINTTAVDTTAACAVTFGVKNANNSANYETKLYGALVEII